MDNNLKGFLENWIPPDSEIEKSARATPEESTLAPVTPLHPPAPPPGTPLPPADASAQERAHEEQALLGQELAALFKDAGVHPVLIFGSRGSGKTSMLASLFRYMQLEVAQATLSLNESLLPTDDPKWNPHAQLARQLYYGKVLDFIKRRAPPATQELTPFFIPVTLTRTSGEEARFAFLEGKGEWYMPNETADVPFKPFHGLLQGLLQNYNSEASVIYAAPYTTGVLSRGGAVESAGNANMQRSDLGLLGVINEYVNLRRATFHRDRHLFLLTKWDMYCDGLSDPAFQHPPGEALQGVIRERFPLAWARFQNLNFQGSAQNKMYSSYSAGLIDDLTVLSPAQSDSDIVDFYPRKLWDLLYEHHTGTPLYPDVRPRRPSLIDRFIQMIRG
jgi:hypothetical protein